MLYNVQAAARHTLQTSYFPCYSKDYVDARPWWQGGSALRCYRHCYIALNKAGEAYTAS
jgi:hypothetical protein